MSSRLALAPWLLFGLAMPFVPSCADDTGEGEGGGGGAPIEGPSRVRGGLTYRPDRSVSAPTEISVPSRVYPDGYAVQCDGCDTNAAGPVLQITAPSAGDTVIVTVVPN